MQLVQFAETYCSDRAIRRNPVHNASRFCRLVGDVPVDAITEDHVEQFRKTAESAGLGAWAIRGTMKDVRTLLKARGRDLAVVPVKEPQPNPQPIPLGWIDEMWSHLADWSRQWLVISMWTGLRFADSIRMQRVVTPEKLEWVARKTKRRHRWPVMPWMVPFLQPVRLPYTPSDGWSEVICRGELARVCKLAGLDKVVPSQIRDTSLREWCRADFHVGQVLHGCKLGVIGRYVDPLDIIEPVAPRVRLPKCFGAGDTHPESELLASFGRLDPQARELVLMTANRLIR